MHHEKVMSSSLQTRRRERGKEGGKGGGRAYLKEGVCDGALAPWDVQLAELQFAEEGFKGLNEGKR